MGTRVKKEVKTWAEKFPYQNTPLIQHFSSTCLLIMINHVVLKCKELYEYLIAHSVTVQPGCGIDYLLGSYELENIKDAERKQAKGALSRSLYR